MLRHRLTDEQWELIADLFPKPKRTGRPPRGRRQIVDGILWILRTGSPWRDLPQAFGPWATVWDLFDTWNADGTLQAILDRVRGEVDRAGLNGIDTRDPVTQPGWDTLGRKERVYSLRFTTK